MLRDCLPFEFYIHIPDYFGDLLAGVNCNWLKDGIIMRSLPQEGVSAEKRTKNSDLNR